MMTSSRTLRTLRPGALGALLFTTTMLTAPAMAQTAKAHRAPDANGVDLVHGDHLMAVLEGSIGSGMAELQLIRNGVWVGGGIDLNGHQWDRIGFRQTPVGGGFSYVVTIGPRFEVFNSTGTLPSGSSLTGGGNNFVYRNADGTTIEFTDGGYGGWGTDSNFCTGYPGQPSCTLVPTAIGEPNGKTVSLDYEMWTYCWGMIEAETLPCNFTPRISAVGNSFGYSIHFAYASSGGGGSGGPPSSWHQRTGASFHNSTVSGNPAQGSVSYAYPSTGVTQVTDMGGRVWRFTGSILGVTGIRRPGASSDTTAISYSGPVVTSVVNEGVTTNYSRNVSGSTGTMTATIVDGDSGTTDPVTTAVSNLTTGRLTSITDPLSRQTQYQYDGNGRLTRVTRPEGNYVQYTYDARGNITEIRQVAKSGSGLSDIVASASYDSSCSNPVTCNSPNSMTDARGNVTNFTYDSTHGGVLTVTAPAPSGSGDRPQLRYAYTLTNGEYRTTSVSSCASGTAPTCVGTAGETVMTNSYDANGNLVSTTVADGTGTPSAPTAMTYDALGNLQTVDGPLSGTADTTRYRYNSARQIVGAIGPDPDAGSALAHRAERITYTNGLPTRSETGTVSSQSDTDWAAFSPAQRVEQDYDANARPIQQRLMSGSTTYRLTQAGYDGFGRAQCVAQRMNPNEFASLPSDACTPDTEGSYGPDRITRNLYTLAGQLERTRVAVGTGLERDVIIRGYTNNGLLAHVIDGENNLTDYVHDGHDRVAYVFHPSATQGALTASSTDYDQLTYDAAGNITNWRLRNGNNIAFAYDTLNRMTGKNLPGSELDVSYGYDFLNRLTSAATSAQTLSFGYDALGRNTSQAGPQGTATSAHDLAGRRTSLTYPGSGLVIGYAYDTASNLTEIRENPAGANVLLATYAYDSLGRRTSLTRGNGATTGYSYDSVSRLGQMVHNLDGATTTNDLTLDYSYNPVSQIAQVVRSNDLYAWGGHYAVNRSYTANGRNQYSAVAGNTPTHDSNGNLTFAGPSGTPAYTYNSENRLVSTSTSVQLGYDPLSRLAWTTGSPNFTRFAHDGDTMIADYDYSGNLTGRYVFGPFGEPLVRYDVPNGSARYYYHQDERGSVIAQSNNSGAMASINAYDEYGIPASGNTGRFQYTGQQWLPELGMQYSRARIYSPSWGRFVQTDPIGFRGGMNLYGYVLNDPVNFTDPSGQCSVVNVGYGWYSPGGDYLGPAPGDYFILDDCDGGFWGGWGGFDPNFFDGGAGTGGGNGPPACPTPSNVSLSGTILVVPAGPAHFSGTLTDVSTGRSYSVSAFGYGGGLAVGSYNVTATVRGFNALSNGLDISFANLPFGFGGARFSDNNGRQIGEGTVSSGISPGALGFPVEAGGASFDPPSVEQTNSGSC